MSSRSIIIFALLLMTEIYQNAAQTIDGRPLNARKQTTNSCPLLVRANNWEIEKFYGFWLGIEMFVHSVNNSSETFEDSCLNIHIVEVNELNEEMTYGKIVDQFNFRLSLRHLKVKFTKNNFESEYFATFNNTNQMLWNGNEIVMQIIRFDGTQMMISICEKEKGELYTISAYRNFDSDDKETDIARKNKLILAGRNLKVFSQHNLRFNCSDGYSSGHKLNFNPMLLYFAMFFVTSLFFI